MKNLKTIKWIVPALLLISLGACEPQLSSDPDLDAPPTSETVVFDMEPTAENPNVIKFTNQSGGFKAMWDFGNGKTAEGDEVMGEFPLPGEYTITLTIFTESGQARNNKTVTIDEISYALLDEPNLNNLTGGIDKLTEGKTWVIDSTTFGHLGLGDINAEGYSPGYFEAGALAKSGGGLYNDRYTFTLDGFAFDMETNGDAFVREMYGDLEIFGNTVPGPGGDDLTAEFPSPETGTFSLLVNDDDITLDISEPAFIGMYVDTRSYKVLELTENRMVIRMDQPDENFAWYHILIPEGYEHPVEEPEPEPEPEPLPYTSEELADNFDLDGNVVWTKNEITEFNESYDNPAPVPINTSPKVAKYVKSDGQFENVYTDLDFDINLNETSVVRLKVYMPSYNDYDTVDPNAPDWSPTKQLTKQVEVKLHDTLNPEPWLNQASIIQQVDVTDTWVELEFDFSQWSDSEIYDKIIVQIGGEAHGMPGIFFIDDFEFTAAQ